MPINPAIAIGADLGTQTFSWTASDVALYNLAVGAATDPLNTTDLEYIHDSHPKVLPSFATVAANFHATEPPKVHFPGVDINLAKVVHGSQEVLVHKEIPAQGTATTHTRISEIQDKGSAAVIFQEAVTTDSSGDKLWTTRSSIFAKGEGGFGGDRGTSTTSELPSTPAHYTLTVSTLPQQALLYRLCGDRNPLHSNPDFAKAAGFPAPILHGLCTYGIVCRAIVDTVAGGKTTALQSYSAKFAGVVYPGEPLKVELWLQNSQLVARVTLPEREDAPALGNVTATLA